jgi:hypothetical protein
MNLASLDRLLRMADVVVDPREDRGRRVRYAYALGETRSRYARPALIAVLNNDDDEAAVRRVAVVALAKIDDSCVVESLIDLLADNDFHVAAAAQKSLQTITKRKGRMDRLPRDPDGPGREEIQDSWRVWWKQHRSRFERRVHHQLPVLQPDSTPRGRDRKPKGAVSSPVVVEFHEERLNIKHEWVKVKDEEISWSHDRERWTVLFAQIPQVKRVRWLKKAYKDRHDRRVPWQEFAAAPDGRPAEGNVGVGQWMITAEIEYKDGRKVIIDGKSDN